MLLSCVTFTNNLFVTYFAKQGKMVLNVQQDNESSQAKKRTIIKNVVGKVRTTFTLPQQDFVFGVPNKMDALGAGSVIEGWAQSEPSKPQTSMRDLPATYREALRNGCLTAKEYATYVKSFPVYKQNPKSSSAKKNPAPSLEEKDEAFGIKSVANEVSIAELLQGNPDIEGAGEYIPVVKKKGRLPPAKPTKSSELMIHKFKSTRAQMSSKTLFKMKKFLKVPSKVDTIRA